MISYIRDVAHILDAWDLSRLRVLPGCAQLLIPPSASRCGPGGAGGLGFPGWGVAHAWYVCDVVYRIIGTVGIRDVVCIPDA